MHVINSARLLCHMLLLNPLGICTSNVSGLSLEEVLALNFSFSPAYGRAQHLLQTLYLSLVTYKGKEIAVYFPKTFNLIYFDNDFSSKDENISPKRDASRVLRCLF